MNGLQKMGRHCDPQERDRLQERLAMWFPHVYVSVQYVNLGQIFTMEMLFP